jgi:cell division protein FtsL
VKIKSIKKRRNQKNDSAERNKHNNDCPDNSESFAFRHIYNEYINIFMSGQGAKIKKILSSRITLFFLLLGFIWLVLSVVNVYYKKYKINKEIEDLKTQIASAEKSNQQISEMIDYLGSSSFLEKEAREKLNMKKPGEEVVIIEPPKDTGTSQNPQPQKEKDQNILLASVASKAESNFVKWWKFFFR